ncbi:MAG: histidine triad nucleotide-binding protein [Candidatus Firestonebacteria bacterium]
MEDCIFCKIAKKEIKSKIVYSDEEIVAFEDVNPQAPIHILIIPRKHIPKILDIDETDKNILFRLIAIANKLANDNKIAESGFRLVLNCNSDAGQTVFHIHLHLLGGRKFSWPAG